MPIVLEFDRHLRSIVIEPQAKFQSIHYRDLKLREISGYNFLSHIETVSRMATIETVKIFHGWYHTNSHNILKVAYAFEIYTFITFPRNELNSWSDRWIWMIYLLGYFFLNKIWWDTIKFMVILSFHDIPLKVLVTCLHGMNYQNGWEWNTAFSIEYPPVRYEGSQPTILDSDSGSWISQR